MLCEKIALLSEIPSVEIHKDERIFVFMFEGGV